MTTYRVNFDGRTLEGTAGQILDGMQERAFFFQGSAAEYIDWLAANLRRTSRIFIDTAPGKPLEIRQEIVVHELLKNQLIQYAGGQHHAKIKTEKSRKPQVNEGPARPD